MMNMSSFPKPASPLMLNRPFPPPPWDREGIRKYAKYYNVLMEQFGNGALNCWKEFNKDPFVPLRLSDMHWLPVRIDPLDSVSCYLGNLGLISGPVPWIRKSNPYRGVSQLCRSKFAHEPSKGAAFEMAMKDIKRAHIMMQLKNGGKLKDFLPKDLTYQEMHSLVSALLELERSPGKKTDLPRPKPTRGGAAPLFRLKPTVPLQRKVSAETVQTVQIENSDAEDWEALSREIHSLVLGYKASWTCKHPEKRSKTRNSSDLARVQRSSLKSAKKATRSQTSLVS